MGILQSMEATVTNHGGRQPFLSQLLEEETVDWQAVRECIRASPEQCQMYCHGAEPSLLLRAIKVSAPVDVVKLLLHFDEDATQQISPDGETILHAASNNPDLVCLILKECREQAWAADNFGRLPLCLATNVEAARHLIEAWPAALMHRSSPHGRTPLHRALHRHPIDPALIRLLTCATGAMDAGKLIMSRDKRGQTPLRLLLGSLEKEFEDALWNELCEWMTQLSDEGPSLHFYIEKGCTKSLPMMESALKSFPDQILQRDRLGRTPLHVAASNGQCDADALTALITANPKAPRMTDNEGRLPIDIAAEGTDTLPHCLALLMKGEPRAVNTRDLMNGYYPFLTSALSAQQNATNTYLLLRSRPEVISYYHTP